MSKLDKINKIKEEENELRRILKLNNKLEYLFGQEQIINVNLNPINIKYKFCKENDNGFIEYKRTLSTYNNKKGKLLRQIYWRIHEYFIEQSNNIDDKFSNTLKCFYVIGLEDDGTPSNMSLQELNDSLQIIVESIQNTNINIKYLYLFNEIDKCYLLLVKFELELNNIDFDFDFF